MTVLERLDLDAFESFCSLLTLDNGAAMRLEPFQRTLLADFFNGARESLVLLPKGAGKTTLMAAVALSRLLTQADVEVVIAAAARDQASILLRQVAGFVRRSPELSARVTVKTRELEHRDLRGRVRVLAADADTADGLLPDLVLVDELHRHRSAELYAILRDGLGKRDGQMVTISTAGDSEESPLGQLRTRAYSLPVQKRDGAYRYAASADASFVLHEWALDAGQDLDDLALVKTANPSSWVTVERLRERRNSPSMTSWQWGRFTCNAWVAGEYSMIAPPEWDSLPQMVIPPAAPVTVGLDLAWKRDTTALVPVWQQSPSLRVAGEPIVLVPPAEGMIDDRDILAGLVALRDGRGLRIEQVVYDPSVGASALGQQIARETGLTMIEHSQADRTMSLADGRLLEAIRRRELAHNGSQTLRSHVLAATERSVPGGGFRFGRPKHGPRKATDALTALSMAHSVVVAEAERPAVSNDWFMF